jgi:hypothetical protein
MILITCHPKNVLYFVVGSNDIGRVKLSVVFNDIIGFIKRVTHTNVIPLAVPYRHDLKGVDITINEEITNFNRKLHKLIKLFPHLSVMEVDVNRHLYTEHGLYLNGPRKEVLSINWLFTFLHS